MSALVFVDTNVLVYAHDADAGTKRDTAVALLETLWAGRTGVVSTQVLEEFYSTATRKLGARVGAERIREALRGYAEWPVQVISVATVFDAVRIAERYRVHFWDGLIVAAAAQAGATTLVSEDFQDGARMAGVRVRNPFQANGGRRAGSGERGAAG